MMQPCPPLYRHCQIWVVRDALIIFYIHTHIMVQVVASSRDAAAGVVGQGIADAAAAVLAAREAVLGASRWDQGKGFHSIE